MSNEISIKTQNDLRKTYSRRIIETILGPGSEKISDDPQFEVLTERPEDRYITGILYSSEAQEDKEDLDPENVDAAVVDNEFKSTSMGLTFYVSSTRLAPIYINVKTAYYSAEKKSTFVVSQELSQQLENLQTKYESLKDSFEIDGRNILLKEFGYKSHLNEVDIKFSKENQEFKNNNKLAINFVEKFSKLSGSFYCRHPDSTRLKINLDQKSELTEINWKLKNAEQIKIFVRIQNANSKSNIGDNNKAITIVVKNTTSESLFQTEIEVDNQVGSSFLASEDLQSEAFENNNQEDKMNEMLYRNKKTYAVGRGVSASWEIEEDSSEVKSLRTTYVPSYEINPMEFEIQGISKDILSPVTYVKDSKEKIIDSLQKFINQYSKWIDNLQNKLQTLPERFTSLGEQNITKCRESLTRMEKSIEFINQDESALKAFRIANEAIILQRMTGNTEKKQAVKTRNYDSGIFSWRPFQLAYILNSLESTLNQNSTDRDILDLIWVPTGGGKTEAYLFSIAIVIAYRRLKYQNSSGVTAIMRYTLRLLTSQQFERAAKLICALDFLRKNDKSLGDEPISIGLWIGGGTENRREKAKEYFFNKMVGANSYGRAVDANEFQVLTCPWCGEKNSLIPTKEYYSTPRRWGYWQVTKHNSNSEMKCLNPECPFSAEGGLPIYVVDDDIYQVRPSLLFGTVDKFAQVPLRQDAERLFGSDDLKQIRRPELIIQDEFHLISGPLGSLVGLFETGFDYVLADSKTNQKPKYIASTATIRNAEEQALGVFNREVQQFPPNGFNAEDNYFVKENYKSHGRQYFGVIGTGKSQITSEVRMFAALLQITKDMKLSENEEELFWTVTGYFNSLRELGKANNLLTSDVADNLYNLEKRTGMKHRPLTSQSISELTSRIPGYEIPKKIKELEISHSESNEAKDVLIASNMLSVGVDISRLNTMLVIGQPKLTSEYIQATSRVGRKSLGSVWTLYNSTRSRDRSHYETFHSYHQNLYKFVESTSVTPFSAPALNKALVSVLTTMLRNTVADMSADDEPANILSNTDEVAKIKDYILNRISNSPDATLYYESAKNILNEICNKWTKLAVESTKTNSELVYYVTET